MEPIIEEISLPALFDPAWKSRLFKHKRTEQKFRLLLGGFAWPASKPGFAVVLGVNYEDDPIKNLPALHCLAEIEEEDVRVLITKCVSLQNEYLVHAWYGDQENPLFNFLISSNHELREMKKKELWLIPPFNLTRPENLGYYSRLIGDSYKERLLLLGDCTKLDAHFDEFPREAAVKGTAEEYPAIAALGYAVASIRGYKPWEYYGERGQEPFEPLDLEAGY